MQNIAIELKEKIGMGSNGYNERDGTTIEAMIGTTTIEMRRETQLLLWGDYTIIEATELLLRDETILLFNLTTITIIQTPITIIKF